MPVLPEDQYGGNIAQYSQCSHSREGHSLQGEGHQGHHQGGGGALGARQGDVGRGVRLHRQARHHSVSASEEYQLITRPNVAGAVLQTHSSLIHSLIQRIFSSKPSKHHYTQTVRSMELKFLENVHLTTCHMLRDRYCVSDVTCHFFSFFFTKWWG